MDVTFTPEQDELRAQARAFLAANPEPAWKEIAELGWTGVSIAEELGGAGLGFLEEAVIFEELGRALAPGPYFATVALALPALPDDLRAEVAAGETSWTLVLGPLAAGLDSADRVAFAAGEGIFELEGAERVLLDTSDETRPLGVVRGGDPGRRVADAAILPAIRARVLAALALEACGVGERALELAVEHARSREQFGRPIGAYQAVSHALADAYTDLQLARSLALRAAWCVAEDDAGTGLAVATAKAAAGEAALGACETAIQVHGGIGFTWEHILHRLYKRALWIESFEATGARLRAEVATILLDANQGGG